MRNIKKMRARNDGTRSLFESVMAPEVVNTLRDWIGSNPHDGVLIGGLALSYYAKPRFTQDIDILYPSEDSIPKTVLGFRRTRGHAFTHMESGVEIEVLSPSFLGLAEGLARRVFETAHIVDGIRVASCRHDLVRSIAQA